MVARATMDFESMDCTLLLGSATKGNSKDNEVSPPLSRGA